MSSSYNYVDPPPYSSSSMGGSATMAARPASGRASMAVPSTAPPMRILDSYTDPFKSTDSFTAVTPRGIVSEGNPATFVSPRTLSPKLNSSSGRASATSSTSSRVSVSGSGFASAPPSGFVIEPDESRLSSQSTATSGAVLMVNTAGSIASGDPTNKRPSTPPATTPSLMTAPAQSPGPAISVFSASPPSSIPQTATTTTNDPMKWLPSRPSSPPSGTVAASPKPKHALPHISQPHSNVATHPPNPPAPRQPPRECLQWLRSLNLETPLTPTTLANGYLIAEIFSRYFPPHALAGRVPRANQRPPIDAIVRSHHPSAAGLADAVDESDANKSVSAREGFPMHSFQNGCGSQCKSRNWAQLRKFLAARLGLDLSPSVIAMVISGHRELAWAVMFECWEVLTGRRLQPSTYHVPDISHPIFSQAIMSTATSGPAAGHTTGHTLSPGRNKPSTTHPQMLPPPASLQPPFPDSLPTYMLPTTSRALHTIPTTLLAQATDVNQLHAQVQRLASECQATISKQVHERIGNKTKKGRARGKEGEAGRVTGKLVGVAVVAESPSTSPARALSRVAHRATAAR